MLALKDGIVLKTIPLNNLRLLLDFKFNPKSDKSLKKKKKSCEALSLGSANILHIDISAFNSPCI
jgi:hypothetical protein